MTLVENIIPQRRNCRLYSPSTSHAMVHQRPTMRLRYNLWMTKESYSAVQYSNEFRDPGFPNRKRLYENHELRVQKKDSGGRRTTRKENGSRCEQDDRSHTLFSPCLETATKKGLDDLLNIELCNDNLKMRQQAWEAFGGGGEKPLKETSWTAFTVVNWNS